MTLVQRVREALAGYGPMREIEMPGGVLFEWDDDLLAAVGNDELRVRVKDGWVTSTGDHDLAEVIEHAAGVVVAECVVRWHEQLRAGGDDAYRAMLGLVHVRRRHRRSFAGRGSDRGVQGALPAGLVIATQHRAARRAPARGSAARSWAVCFADVPTTLRTRRQRQGVLRPRRGCAAAPPMRRSSSGSPRSPARA
ncbi:hypothetical protein [Lentzea californiensis]|uniref:hypothetical protein n=1 Tax=Lentzea californiensis TaxID=438851 RepID=UPI0021658548|nr:hypothetical protein [Lentzea californiensis]